MQVNKQKTSRLGTGDLAQLSSDEEAEEFVSLQAGVGSGRSHGIFSFPSGATGGVK